MYRYIIGYKDDKCYMISSLNEEDVFDKEIKKFNNNERYRYEERNSKIDIRKEDYKELLNDLKLYG